MLPLLFIVMVVSGCILISIQLNGEEVTWFTYFKGVVAGFFVSGVVLEVYNTWRRKKEEEEAKKPKKIEL